MLCEQDLVVETRMPDHSFVGYRRRGWPGYIWVNNLIPVRLYVIQ